MRKPSAALTAAVLAATVVLSTGAAPGAAAAERELRLDPAASRATFHLHTTLHDVEGRLALGPSRVRFDPVTGAASGAIVLDARRTETGNGLRDKRMHARVLESERFPRITFVPDRVLGAVPEAGEGDVRLHGTIELHGERHGVTLPVHLRVAGDHLVATSRFTVPYVAWGLADPSLFPLAVSPEVEVELTAEAVLQAAPAAPAGEGNRR